MPLVFVFTKFYLLFCMTEVHPNIHVCGERSSRTSLLFETEDGDWSVIAIGFPSSPLTDEEIPLGALFVKVPFKTVESETIGNFFLPSFLPSFLPLFPPLSFSRPSSRDETDLRLVAALLLFFARLVRNRKCCRYLEDSSTLTCSIYTTTTFFSMQKKR